MTVITFAKKQPFSASFGRESSYHGGDLFRRYTLSRAIRWPRTAIDLIIALTALTAIAAMLSITVLGINSSILVFRLARMESKISSLLSEIEHLKLQSLQFLRPETLVEKAHMLQLVESNIVHYVTAESFEELARK